MISVPSLEVLMVHWLRILIGANRAVGDMGIGATARVGAFGTFHIETSTYRTYHHKFRLKIIVCWFRCT